MSETANDTTYTTETVGNPTYVVLHKGDNGYWSIVEEVEARGARDAIKAVCNNGLTAHTPIGDAGTFVAVPLNSWKPVTVRTETQMVVKMEDARS